MKRENRYIKSKVQGAKSKGIVGFRWQSLVKGKQYPLEGEHHLIEEEISSNRQICSYRANDRKQ